MRKIEMNMNAAVMLGRNWSEANTRTVRPSNDRTVTAWEHRSAAMDVFLHGHHIATVWNACDGRDRWTVEVNTDTLRAWPTRTTMSRLRALGADVCTRKGEVLLNGEAI